MFKKSIDDVILYNDYNEDLINNPLKLIELKNEFKNKHVISIIRINSFSFISENNFSKIGLNVKLPSYDKNNSKEYDNYLRALCNELLKLNNELPEFDLVIIDESQNIRKTDSKKAECFSAFFGLYYKNNESDNDKMKFKKTLFLTATPYHNSEKDVFNQMSFVIKKEKKINILNKKEDLTKKNLNNYINIIKRNRIYNNHSKFYYREYETTESEMTFHEGLTMALIQKNEIAQNGYIFRIGSLDGFERFYKDTLNNNKDEIPNEDELSPDSKDKIDTYLIDYFKEDLENKFKNKANDILSHPKPRAIKDIISEKNHDNTKIDKTLIFVRIKSTIKDIEKVLVDDYDNTLTDLIDEIINIKDDDPKKAIEKFENELLGKNDKEDEEISDDSLENNYYGDDDKKKNEPYESSWLKELRVKPTNNTILPNYKKRFLNYNKFDELFEEDYFKLLGFNIKDINYNKNEDKLEVEFKEKGKYSITVSEIKEKLKNKDVSISDKKLKRLTRKRVVNLILLEKLAKDGKIWEYIPKEYESFYFGKEVKHNKDFNIDLFDLQTLFKNNPSIWDKEYFNLNQLMYNNENIKFEKEMFLKREFIKDIIKSNIINSESILYFIALVCKLEKDKKDINYRDILKEIVKNKNKNFWKRIYNRVQDFFKSFTSDDNEVPDIDALLNHLGYSNFYKNDNELDDKKIQDILNKRQFCRDSIVGCSSNNDGDNVYNKSIWFNTSFYPDIMIATDIVKEGIDLQRNCSHIIHYGIAWTPGDMEQRIGRIDRYFSKTYREYKDDDKSKGVRITFLYMKNTIDERQIENITSKMINAVKVYNKNDIESILVTKKDKEVDISKESDPIDANIEILNSIKNIED